MPSNHAALVTQPPRTRRADVPFRWSVSADVSTYSELAGIAQDRMFLEVEAIQAAYRQGYPAARECFGPQVKYAGPRPLTISYGHINCLGAPLTFPPGSEVAHQPIYDSLAQAAREIRRPVDWSSAGLMPRMLALWRRLGELFPEQPPAFDFFRSQGPFTTAWALRGHDFFTDMYDDPPLFMQYLHGVVDSIVSYRQFLRAVQGETGAVGSVFLTDDLAAMVPPRLWPTLVTPVLERYFALQSAGPRGAHIEDLTVDHLPQLEVLALERFDPSVSPRLTPADLRDRTAVVFSWLLNPMQTRDFTLPEIERYLQDAARAGASALECHVAQDTVKFHLAPKVRHFIAVGREIAAEGR